MPRLRVGEKKYKYQRDDVIRKRELDLILHQIGLIKYMGISGSAWQCLVAILWLFGKRIGEVVRLKTEDIFIKDNQLCIRFLVLKKKTREDPGVLRLYTKRITLDNPYTDYVIDYWEPNKDRERFLFPRPSTKTGHIFREYAWAVLKMVKEDISAHLFRHSLATQMAEDGASAYELVTWFDWDRTDTALEYVRRSGHLTERLSGRKW